MGSYGVAQAVAIPNHLAIDENHHMFADPALLVEHVSARPFVLPKVLIEHLAQRGPGGLARRTLDVTLNVSSESKCSHIRLVSVAERSSINRLSEVSRMILSKIDSRRRIFFASTSAEGELELIA
jgi:hypothetical protein